MSVKTWFVNLWTNTKGALSNFFSGPGGKVVREALGTVVQQAGAIGISMLLDIAKGKVSALNTSNLSNDAKRIQVLDYLKGYALDQGINVGESTLRYVLETAVSAVKGDQL